MASIKYALTSGVGVLEIDNPPVNATSHHVRVALIEQLENAQADDRVTAIVLIGMGSVFIAGADIREFNLAPKSPLLPEVQAVIEASSKPVVAALHGAALGGGLETAMCCHYRIALRSVKLGLPEVSLGLLPGGGGTQRLPRLVGAEKALDMMLSGKPVDGEEGLNIGLVDQLAEGVTRDALLAQAITFAKAVANLPLRRVSDDKGKLVGTEPELFDRVISQKQNKWQGLPAPLQIVECVRAAFEAATYADSDKIEKQAFQVLRSSPQSSALRYAFFAERAANKIPGLGPDVKAKAINRVAIVGAGTMGGGIAMAIVNHGLSVQLLDTTDEALQIGMARIKTNYQVSVGRGSMTQAAAEKALSLLQTTTSYEDIAQADIVIEAVFENMAVKQAIFRQLDQVMKADAILASNTSALDIDQIAAVTNRPESVIGMHFFSPANIMKLQENVRGRQSSDETIVSVMNFAKKIGKIAVLAGNCDGFIGNRISAVYSRECDFMLEEGATPWQIDNALKGFGFPMGVYLMKDMAGLDIGWSIRKNRAPTRDKSLRYSPVADRICEQGRFGQKTGAGYYRYEGRNASPDPAVEALIKSISKELGISRRSFSDSEIVERVLAAMANEGAKVVSDGIAIRPSDIDVVYLNGFGFPRYQGGPMYWAQTHGLDRVLGVVNHYYQEQGALWAPAKLLQQRAVFGSWVDETV